MDLYIGLGQGAHNLFKPMGKSYGTSFPASSLAHPGPVALNSLCSVQACLLIIVILLQRHASCLTFIEFFRLSYVFQMSGNTGHQLVNKGFTS